MLPTPSPQNTFLIELLSLQQDGRGAISAPTNWTGSRPLLEVETPLDEIGAELAETCLIGNGNKIARWHFFIGSPGNGKSAAVGKLVRALMDRGCAIVDEHETNILSLGTTTVPYSLDVTEAGKKFVSVRIIQDASVVRSPYAAGVDPSRDLLDTLHDAWESGISLVVCTNRGVLEKAYRDTYLDGAFRNLPWHRVILKGLVERDDSNAGGDSTAINFDGRKPVFESLLSKSTFLDKRSLILRQQDILERLIQRAVDSRNWQVCKDCEVAAMCPFRANRDWLADAVARKNIIRTLRRAEVLSSQVIVFREALAIVSFLLAGCARDYKDTNPCGWVRTLVARRDIFGLGSRRVHMCLYGTTSPRSLDSSEEIRARQIEALRLLHSKMDAADRAVAAPLTALLDDVPPSADVGVTRLFGHGGVFTKLDAINGPVPSGFSDRWDGSYERMLAQPSPMVAGIDRACIEAWQAYETFAENLPSHAAEAIHWSVRRWSSQYTLHLGVVAEGVELNGEEIDEFTELLELLWKERINRTMPEKIRLADLEKQISTLLNRGAVSDEGTGPVGISVSENVAVLGSWIDAALKPGVVASGASGSLTIGVTFGPPSAQTRGQTTLAAPMYLWLRQRAKGTMDARCIPADLLSDAMDAKSRAVGKSRYAFEPNDVSLRIAGSDGVFKIERYDGETTVDVET